MNPKRKRTELERALHDATFSANPVMKLMLASRPGDTPEDSATFTLGAQAMFMFLEFVRTHNPSEMDRVREAIRVDLRQAVAAFAGKTKSGVILPN